ncbi:MAG: hypothetical protein GEU99_21035 [Luteitalea sp.]|nr:hypothetical protein [Luteitalea sp.]
MRLAFFSRSAGSALLGVFLLTSAPAQGQTGRLAAQAAPADVPFSAIVETIEFNDVSQETQKLVLDRIGVRPGDTLTVEARRRIARELRTVQKGMTFTYKSGAQLGTATLIISAEC